MTKKSLVIHAVGILRANKGLKKSLNQHLGRLVFNANFPQQQLAQAATFNNVQDINVVISCLAFGIMENPFDFGLSSAQIQAFDWGLEAKFKSFHLIFPNFIVLQFFSAASLRSEESRIEGGGIRNSVRKVYQLERNLSLVYLTLRDF